MHGNHRSRATLSAACLASCSLAAASMAAAGPRDEVLLPDPSPDPVGSLGSSALLHPSWVIVGAREKRFLTATRELHSYGSLVLWPRATAGAPLLEPTVVWPLLPIRGARFGEALALDGDRLLVGEPGYKTSATAVRAQGRVQVVDLSIDPPAAVELIERPVMQVGLEFGTAVGLDGDVALIGAPGRIPEGTTEPHGIAYLFERTEAESATASWSLTRSFEPPSPDGGGPGGRLSRFGSAVALHTADALIAAPSALILPSLGYGRVYVYDRIDGSLRQTLTAPTPTLGDRFGTTMALDGSLVAIAAPDDECGFGAVHLYRRDKGAGWVFEATLEAPGGAKADDGWTGFGNSINIDRDRVVIGTGGIASEDRYGHRAAIFCRQGPIGQASSWILEATYEGDASLPTGSPVAIDPRTVVLGESSIDFGRMRAFTSEPSLDLDFDGFVGPGDLASLLGAWGAGAGHPAEFTGDGVVDQADLAVLLGGWS